MNDYIREIYTQRLAAAEAARQQLIEKTDIITERWRQMSKEGRLYTKAQRDADSKALETAEDTFRQVLLSVYELEDAERTDQAGC